MDLALNNLKWLICHKTKQNQTVTWTPAKFNNYYSCESTKMIQKIIPQHSLDSKYKGGVSSLKRWTAES